MNIFRNYIPNKVLTFNDSDPPWVNDQIKRLIKLKNDLLVLYLQNGKKHAEYLMLQDASQQISDLIQSSRDEYFSRLAKKLNNPKTSAKTYWKILKTFVNGKKIPSIPPLLENGKYVTNFSTKANVFNTFFAQQCTDVVTNSSIPTDQNFLTNNRLSNINFNTEDIKNIIDKLDPNKAHGHDGISIRMIQLSCQSVIKPLFLIYKNCIECSSFPVEWKKGCIIPIHKKGDKQLVSNYRPISLLPIFSKIFERILFNNLFKYLDQHALLNPNQSGFRPGDSCIHQLISITHDIYENFDSNPTQEVRGLFLDISKAFDRVWHLGLLYKIKNFGINGKFFDLIESFLSERYQQVTINGQSSHWLPIKAGVPQGSILGPLLFLIFINDLPDGLQSNVKLFADDTALFCVDSPVGTANELNLDLKKVNDWALKWKMLFNPDSTKPVKEVIFSRKINKVDHPELIFNNVKINNCASEKHLGLILDKKLNFKEHSIEKINKAMKIVGTIKKLRNILPRSSLLTIYKSLVRPHLDYGDVIYAQINNQSFTDRIESVQYNAALAITGAIRGTSRDKLYKELGMESLQNRQWMRRLCYFYKIFTTQLPAYLFDYLPPKSISQRYPNTFKTYRCRTISYQNSFFPYSVKQWNQLDSNIRNCTSYSVFRIPY